MMMKLMTKLMGKLILCEKCPYSKFFWFIISRIWTEYGEILLIYPYLVRMRENTDHKNFKYGHFFRNVKYVALI